MRKMVLLLFVLNLTFLFAENWTYKVEKIELPTGKAESEIYIYDAPDHLKDAPDEGPTKFQIDENGYIYILDGKKIKIYDETGKYLFSTEKQDLVIHSFLIYDNIIYTICGDYQNNVFLSRFDINCQLIDTHQINNRKSTLSINQNERVGLNLSNNNFLEFNFNGDDLVTSNSQYLNDCILDFNLRERKQMVLIPEENIELNLNKIWPNEIGHSFIGFDENGNLYFNIYSKPLGDSNLGIVSQFGEVIETNVIFPHYTQFGLDLARGIPNIVTPDGQIYQMIPMKEKIEIRKWKKVE